MTGTGQPTDADAFRALQRVRCACGWDVRVVHDGDGLLIVVDAQPKPGDLEVIAWDRHVVWVGPVEASYGDSAADRGLVLRRHACREVSRG